MTDYDQNIETNLTTQDKARLAVQGLIAVWLVVGLAGHLAVVGLIGLSYGTMLYMALPYTIVLILVGLAATYLGLYDVTQWLYDINIIEHHSGVTSGSETAPH